ncbi:hypothetical protein GLOIN_2v1788173 [Rhizophagus irregularis DAOM 181602=DAOM 197198]|nr:hypothetical protein GLOIN_2v1788173 [Rhizophagus irregularis DAOM 181602=DAOM 197198]
MTLNRALHKLQLQMGSSLICRKRKANEIDDEYDMDKVLGTVIDAEKWYFVECTLDEERKPSFKLSEPVIVEYNDENMQIKLHITKVSISDIHS